jgi:chromosome segregation ATPase
MTQQLIPAQIITIIADINQLVEQIQKDMQLSQTWLEFESVDLPFKLSESGFALWKSIYSPEILRNLAKDDDDTLNAWAIALSQTLNTQIEILHSWLPHLATLPIPETLKQRISDRASTLSHIAHQKSQLLQSVASILSQEQQLKQDASELQTLKQKVQELQQIQLELQTTNLENLRQEITTQTNALSPQKQELEILKQQKIQLDEQIFYLRQQQTRLEGELDYLRSHYLRLENNTITTASELITLSKAQQQQLSQVLSSVLIDLEQQRAEFEKTRQQLQKAVQDFNQYQNATAQIESHLKSHYESNYKLGQILPVNHQKVDHLLKTIKQNLGELDQELIKAQIENEQSQQKTIVTF